MDKQDYILLFNSIHPDFFKSEYIIKRPEKAVSDEMFLLLSEFDAHKYEKQFDDKITFGYFHGNCSELKTAVEKVEPSWYVYFDEKSSIYCGYDSGRIVSFCLIDDMGTHEINGRRLRIGGPGCVGTLPEYRNRGIGLTMVNKATEILKENGYDYSYIHFTGVAKWYEKLGYKTELQWNKYGII